MSANDKRNFYFKVSPANSQWQVRPKYTPKVAQPDHGDPCGEDKENERQRKEVASQCKVLFQKNVTSKKEFIVPEPRPRKSKTKVRTFIEMKADLDQVSPLNGEYRGDRERISEYTHPYPVRRAKQSSRTPLLPMNASQSAPNTPARFKIAQIPTHKTIQEPGDKRVIDLMATPQRLNYCFLFNSIASLSCGISPQVNLDAEVLKQLPVSENTTPSNRLLSTPARGDNDCFTQSNTPNPTKVNIPTTPKTRFSVPKKKSSMIYLRTPVVKRSAFYSPGNAKQQPKSPTTLRATALDFYPVQDSPKRGSEVSENDYDLPRPQLPRPNSMLRVHSGLVTPSRTHRNREQGRRAISSKRGFETPTPKSFPSSKKGNEERENKIFSPIVSRKLPRPSFPMVTPMRKTHRNIENGRRTMPSIRDFESPMRKKSPTLKPCSPKKYWGDTPVATPIRTPRRKKEILQAYPQTFPRSYPRPPGLNLPNDPITNRPKTLLWGDTTPKTKSIPPPPGLGHGNGNGAFRARADGTPNKNITKMCKRPISPPPGLSPSRQSSRRRYKFRQIDN